MFRMNLLRIRIAFGLLAGLGSLVMCHQTLHHFKLMILMKQT